MRFKEGESETDNMNVLAAGESESLEHLTADTSCPNHQNLGALQTNNQIFKNIYEINFRVLIGTRGQGV